MIKDIRVNGYPLSMLLMKPLSEKEFNQIIDNAKKHKLGDYHEISKAIGMLTLGQHLGWKVLLLIHDKKTIAKYEKILGIDVREEFPEVGKLAERSLAWRMSQKVGNFWKAVKGEIPGIRSPKIDK